jgi:hypothetical protein
MALQGVSLNAATAVGAGQTIAPDTPKLSVSMCAFATGNPNATIDLEGTIDGVNWNLIARLDLTSGGAQVGFTVAPGAFVCAAFRANLTALSGGTSPAVSASLAIA